MEQNNIIHNHERSIEEPLTEEHNLDYAASLTKAALDYTAAGISVFPAYLAGKNPALETWTIYRDNIPERDTILSWKFDSRKGLAIPCGPGSGNLEMIDFDQNHCLTPDSLFDAWKTLVDVQCSGLVDKLVHEKSQSGGDHIYYRCSEIDGNTKLARRPASDKEKKANPPIVGPITLIETRGKGGFVLCHPSEGYSNVSGSLTHVPEITPEERDILWDYARAFNLFVAESKTGISTHEGERKKRNDRPGDIYNERGDISEVLNAYGWKHVGGKGLVEYWRRPGKNLGVSATYHKEMKKFFVWSSNAGPFEQETAYEPFSVYTILKHDKDFGKAAKDLASQGYGNVTVHSKGKPTLADVEEYLKDRYCFRRNVITQAIERRRLLDSKFEEMTDYELNSLFRELQHADLPLNIETLDRILRSDFTENYDPVRFFFAQLEPWDGATDYIEELADTIRLDDDLDKKLFKDYLTRWLVAQIGCALDPKIVNQTAIVLVGAQGQGKTTWLNKLLPPTLEDYGYLGPIDPSNKDTLVFLARKILVNIDELETFNKGDLGRLKSIMTQAHISVRLPYGRVWEELPRRASFVASVNFDEFLNDPTGSRRFLVFKVKGVNAFHTVDMNGVYAQAYTLYESGHQFYFSPDEILNINDRNRQHFKKGYEHELLDTLCEPGDESKKDGEWYSATALAEKVKVFRDTFRVDNGSVKNIGYALNQDGYSKKSPKGHTQYYVKWK